jgi:hypothetical protein
MGRSTPTPVEPFGSSSRFVTAGLTRLLFRAQENADQCTLGWGLPILSPGLSHVVPWRCCPSDLKIVHEP